MQSAHSVACSAVLRCAVLSCDSGCDSDFAWQALEQLQGDLVSGPHPQALPLKAPRSTPSCQEMTPSVSRLQKQAVQQGSRHLATVLVLKATRYTAVTAHAVAGCCSDVLLHMLSHVSGSLVVTFDNSLVMLTTMHPRCAGLRKLILTL